MSTPQAGFSSIGMSIDSAVNSRSTSSNLNITTSGSTGGRTYTRTVASSAQIDIIIAPCSSSSSSAPVDVSMQATQSVPRRRTSFIRPLLVDVSDIVLTYLNESDLDCFANSNEGECENEVQSFQVTNLIKNLEELNRLLPLVLEFLRNYRGSEEIIRKITDFHLSIEIIKRDLNFENFEEHNRKFKDFKIELVYGFIKLRIPDSGSKNIFLQLMRNSSCFKDFNAMIFLVNKNLRLEADSNPLRCNAYENNSFNTLFQQALTIGQIRLSAFFIPPYYKRNPTEMSHFIEPRIDLLISQDFLQEALSLAREYRLRWKYESIARAYLRMNNTTQALKIIEEMLHLFPEEDRSVRGILQEIFSLHPPEEFVRLIRKIYNFPKNIIINILSRNRCFDLRGTAEEKEKIINNKIRLAELLADDIRNDREFIALIVDDFLFFCVLHSFPQLLSRVLQMSLFQPYLQGLVNLSNHVENLLTSCGRTGSSDCINLLHNYPSVENTSTYTMRS